MTIDSNTSDGKAIIKRNLWGKVRDYIKGGDSEFELEDNRDNLQLLKEGVDYRPYFFGMLERGELNDNTIVTAKRVITYKAFKDENGVKTIVKEEGFIKNNNVRIALYDSLTGKHINNVQEFYEDMKKKGREVSIKEKIVYW